MKEFQDIFFRFIAEDANRFKGCLQQSPRIDYGGDTKILEWRIRKKDNIMCIIEYYPDRYYIYELNESDTEKLRQ